MKKYKQYEVYVCLFLRDLVSGSGTSPHKPEVYVYTLHVTDS